ncbi:MAG: hypothetical protein R3A47_12050 [Polyangiales bacterium]
MTEFVVGHADQIRNHVPECGSMDQHRNDKDHGRAKYAVYFPPNPRRE